MQVQLLMLEGPIQRNWNYYTAGNILIKGKSSQTPNMRQVGAAVVLWSYLCTGDIPVLRKHQGSNTGSHPDREAENTLSASCASTCQLRLCASSSARLLMPRRQSSMRGRSVAPASEPRHRTADWALRSSVPTDMSLLAYLPCGKEPRVCALYTKLSEVCHDMEQHVGSMTRLTQ